MASGQGQNTGEGTSRENYVPLETDGLFIDLNQPYEGENMNEPNDEDIGQFQNVEERTNYDFDLNMSP